MMLPTQALLDASFVFETTFGTAVGRFTGVSLKDGRPKLCFEGWEPEEGAWTLISFPEFFKSMMLVGMPKPMSGSLWELGVD